MSRVSNICPVYDFFRPVPSCGSPRNHLANMNLNKQQHNPAGELQNVKSPSESTRINVICEAWWPSTAVCRSNFSWICLDGLVAEVATLFRGILALLPASCLASKKHWELRIHGTSGKWLNWTQYPPGYRKNKLYDVDISYTYISLYIYNIKIINI